MINLFDTDGGLYKVGMVLADIFLLSFLWIIFSIPILTIGASTTAVYYVCTKKAAGSDSYILQGFFKSFKQNLLVSTVAFVILALIGYVLWLNYHALPQVELGVFHFPVRIALFIAVLQVIFVSMYIFPIISRFNVTVFGGLKSALLLANGHLFTTICNLVLLGAIFIVINFIPALFIFIPGIFVYFSASLFVKVFRKYGEDL